MQMQMQKFERTWGSFTIFAAAGLDPNFFLSFFFLMGDGVHE